MLRRVALALLIVVGSALLGTSGVFVVRIVNPNGACELAGSPEASDALGPDGGGEALADRGVLRVLRPRPARVPAAHRRPLDVSTEDAQAHYGGDRASYEAGQPHLVLHDEDLGVPAYSVIWGQSDRTDTFCGDSVCAYALGWDHYLLACIFTDRYGSVEDAWVAAVRLVRAALERG